MRIHLLDVPYEDRQEATALRARWNPALRSWVHFTRDGSPLPAGLDGYRAPRHSWEAWREQDLNGEVAVTEPAGQVILHPHQVLAADLIESAWTSGRPGFLLADEVGLGKTFSALAGVNRLPGRLNVLVLCPLSVVPHWRASIDAFGSPHRFCVINYDRSKKLLEIPEAARTAKRKRTQNQRTVTKGTSLVAWDVIVVDEAHLLKNPTSQRSAAVRQLQGGRSATSFMVWCSATAGQNPVELSYLNRLIAAVTGRKLGAGLDDFQDWCRSLGLQVKKSFGGLVWSPNPEDLATMNELLFAGPLPAAIRRRPHDIAGWPELERIAWPVELSPASMQSYRRSWEEVRQALLDDRAQTLTRKGAGRPHEATHPLVALLRFRQKASALRIDATVDLVETMLENNKQVAVSVEFTSTLEAIVGRLQRKQVAVAAIHGGLSPAARESQRLAFQTGQSPVVVFTVKEGISLHAGEQSSGATTTPRVTIVHDPRWDAISTAQIEGRTWRDGQHSTCYHAYAAGTVEEQVVATMLGKLEAMKTMLSDDDVPDVLALLVQVAGL
jgi:hypothetical protein